MLALFAALFCVLANGFFVAAEFALVKVRATSMEAAAANGDVKAQRALNAIQNLDAYLGATQLGITLASLALGWLGEPALAVILEPLLAQLHLSESTSHAISLACAFSIITLLHIVVGELAPKSLAIQYPERVVRWSATAMHAFFYLTYPFLYVLNGSANLLLRALGIQSADHHSPGAPSAEEIRLIVQASFRAGSLEGTQRDLLERVLRGSGRSVRAIMVPRVDMSVLSVEADLDSTEMRMRKEGYSRYPLSENNNPDRIVGYLYTKDVWTAPRPFKGTLAALRRDILFVPESRTVAEVLEDFRLSNIPIAIVVDEYGGTSGLVTLEDCVEEIVGDIRDETDDEPAHTLIRPDGSVVVDGSIPFGDLEIEELRDLVQDRDETVGAYVIDKLGRLPKPGDRVRIGEFEIVVELVRRRRVSRVAFRTVEPEATRPTPTPS